MCSLNINNYSYTGNVPANYPQQEKTEKLELIETFFATTKQEKDRSSFDETYYLVYNLPEGEKFIGGLIDNKDIICETLDLTDEQYYFFACEALALASQETGMGQENGYDEENTGIGKVIRNFAKWCDVTFNKGSSASSGLTQIKINDFINNGLDETSVNLLKEIGVEIKGKNRNNLYDNPDKSAAATVVILNSISQNYGNYLEMLNSEHIGIAQNLQDGLSEEERVNKGEEILNKIIGIYDFVGDEQKSEIRSTFKSWVLSANGTVKNQLGVDDDYNEELNLEKFNKILKKNGATEEIKQEDLDYIRYFLTSDSQEMNLVEYCAYAWNKGTGNSGMQLDRTLAEKIGIILIDPEDYDYELFALNVSILFDKYARQMDLDTQQENIEKIFSKEY